jgi:hypothetical protein
MMSQQVGHAMTSEERFDDFRERLKKVEERRREVLRDMLTARATQRGGASCKIYRGVQS